MKRQFFTRHIPFLTKFFFFAFIFLVGYAVIAQTILVPHAITAQYDQQLNPDLKQVRAKFNALSKSSELPIYNDPYSNAQTGRGDLLETQKLIAETYITLSNYEQRANTLPTTALAKLSGNYKKAEVVRARAKDVLLQSREVINGYKDLTAYLLQVNTARTVLKNDTADINSLADLNRLAGQGDVIAKRAHQLSDTIDTMKRLPVPPGFTEYNAALSASFIQSQAGLEQLSRGLFASDDSQINAGVAVLEQAILKIESSDSTLFTTASTNSITLSETSKLVDKIDSLQPFLEQ